ncbi:MAG TPA: type II secretion system protein [Burkholderiales bacterium]|nr:type II secretion system protein [Burkholderiales bacterium]
MRREFGFTYLTVLFIVAIMGAGLSLTGELWHTAAIREKEAELLFTGNQYREAIERYYLAGPQQYPRALEDLIKDPRKPGTVRHLRRLYQDPMGDSGKWGLVDAPEGGIMGVHSISDGKPIKSTGFGPLDAGFERVAKYSDWKFIFAPTVQGGATAPAKSAAQPR